MLTEKDVLLRVSGVTRMRLQTWVERGWLSPAQTDTGHAFSDLDIARCALIRQMRDDLEFDDETVPVLLALLDQVYGLRRELRAVLRAVEAQPDDISSQILEVLKSGRDEIENGD